jgi:hypothetical protein
MIVLLAVEAALQAQYLDSHNLNGTRAAVAIYFLIAFWFTSTLECVGYVYGCEIWPTQLRSKGSAISYFGFYIFSIWSTAPAAQAFATIGWKYYMVFISVTFALVIPCMFYLPEASFPVTHLLPRCHTDSTKDCRHLPRRIGCKIWRPRRSRFRTCYGTRW